MENPLLEVKTPIPFDAVRAEHVAPATDALLERLERELAGLSGGNRSPSDPE